MPVLYFHNTLEYKNNGSPAYNNSVQTLIKFTQLKDTMSQGRREVTGQSFRSKQYQFMLNILFCKFCTLVDMGMTRKERLTIRASNSYLCLYSGWNCGVNSQSLLSLVLTAMPDPKPLSIAGNSQASHHQPPAVRSSAMFGVSSGSRSDVSGFCV